MDTVQVGLFFVVSYLLSRVFVVLKIPELIVYYLFEKKHISIQKLTLILILGSALLSAVIANVITVLTLMPLVLLLQKEFDAPSRNKLKINTLFLLSVIWGANIGGIGMITGTTTNGILIGLYEVFKVPFGMEFNFFNWMVWGIPLLIAMSFIGWGILMIIFQPGKIIHMPDLSHELEAFTLSRRLQKVGFYIASAFIISASLLSVAMNHYEDNRLLILIVTIIWMAAFMYLMLVHNWRTEGDKRERLLRFKDTLHDIPKRGILWIVIGVIVTVVLWYLKLHKVAGHWMISIFDGSSSIFVMFFLMALIATFASELFSNSGVQVTMFMVLFPLLKHNPNMSWEAMLIITLCSTCAFMSPIGTPSNGLGYGSSSKISLKYMLISGFVMNIASALCISLWVFYLVPLINRFTFKF